MRARFEHRDAESLEADPDGVAVAGRITAIRSFGKLLFLNLVENGAKIQVSAKKHEIAPELFRRIKSFDVADFVRVEGPRLAHADRRAHRGRRGRAAPREGPAPAAGEVARTDRRRGAFPAALPRPARERGSPPDRAAPEPHDRGDARLPRRPGLRRGRDAGAAAAVRRRRRAPVQHAPQHLRSGSVSPHLGRALLEAAGGRRPRPRLRDRSQLPQRGGVAQTQPRVHHDGVLSGLRGLPRHDGPDRGDDPRDRARGVRRRAGRVPGTRPSISAGPGRG